MGWNVIDRSVQKMCIALFIFGVSGSISVFLDLDHIPYILKIAEGGRLFHPAYAVIAGIIFCGVIAYYIRLWIKKILEEKRCLKD